MAEPLTANEERLLRCARSMNGGMADYGPNEAVDRLLATLDAERALHPVSDATPDLALYDLPALASEPVPATGLRWIGSGVSVSRQLAGEPVPATPACICGRAVPVAGTCFDIDGAYWSGHGEPAPATGNPEPCPSCGITGNHSANCADVERFATRNPEEIDVDALGRFLHGSICSRNAAHFPDDDISRCYALAREYARQREGERP